MFLTGDFLFFWVNEALRKDSRYCFQLIALSFSSPLGLPGFLCNGMLYLPHTFSWFVDNDAVFFPLSNYICLWKGVDVIKSMWTLDTRSMKMWDYIFGLMQNFGNFHVLHFWIAISFLCLGYVSMMNGSDNCNTSIAGIYRSSPNPCCPLTTYVLPAVKNLEMVANLAA